MNPLFHWMMYNLSPTSALRPACRLLPSPSRVTYDKASHLPEASHVYLDLVLGGLARVAELPA
jgi:hypothetical protein